MSTIADTICRAVAELPDRNSPEGWPEAMLVTHDELRSIVLAALSGASPTPQPELLREVHAQIRHLIDDLTDAVDDGGLVRYIPRQNLTFSNCIAALIPLADRLLGAAPTPQPELTDAPRRPIDANELERMAKERPNERFLKGSGVLKLTGAIRQLEQEVRSLRAMLGAAPTQAPQQPADEHDDRDTEQRLNACPKCGGKPVLDEWFRADSARMVQARCSKCGHKGDEHFATQGDIALIAEWNATPTEGPQQPAPSRKCLYCERDMIPGSECLSKAQSESCGLLQRDVETKRQQPTPSPTAQEPNK